MSDELKKLKQMESQFCAEFSELRKQVQEFSTSLLDHARTSYELEIMLNYDLVGPIWDPGNCVDGVVTKRPYQLSKEKHTITQEYHLSRFT